MPDDRAVEAAIEEHAATAGELRLDYEDVSHRRPDGAVRWLHRGRSPSTGRTATPLRMAGVSLRRHGAEARRRMRQALVDLSDMFRGSPITSGHCPMPPS